MQIHGFYNWPRIAARTEKVYEAAVTSWRDDTLMGRFCRYYQCGSWFGKICCCVAAVVFLYWKWLELLHPRSCIDKAVDFGTQRSLEMQESICDTTHTKAVDFERPYQGESMTERDECQVVKSCDSADAKITKTE